MSDKIWIIKEGSEIFGPFNQAEIIAQINNKEILETDQIAPPFSKFEFLKDCEDFNLLFKMIDHTEVGKTEHTAATEKVDQVDPSITGFFDITVQKPKGVSRPHHKKLPSKTTIDKKKTDQKKPIDGDKKATEDKKLKPVDLVETPTQIEKTNKPIYQMLIPITGLTLIGLCLFYYQQQFVMQQQAQKEEINEKLFNQAVMDKKIGNYEKSSASLRNILRSKPDHLQAFFHLVEVLILQEKYKEAQDLLNNRLLNITSNMRHHIYHYLALIDLQTKELSRAMEYLTSALKQEPSFVPAIINLGTLYFLNEEYEKATEQYNSTAVTSSKDYSEFEGVLMLHQAANAVKNYLSLEDTIENLEETTEEDDIEEDIQYKILNDLSIQLEEYQERTYNFKLEASMMSALLELLLGNIQVSKRLLKNTLNLDWDLTNQHFHNVLYYYLDRLLWSNIIISTFEIKNFEWNEDPELLALYGLLHFKKGDREEGREYIYTAVDLDQNNDRVNTLLAYIQDKLNLKDNACAVLRSIKERDPVSEPYEPNYLSNLLQQRLCINNNNIQEQKGILTDIQLSNYFQLQTLTGFAHLSEREQNRIAAKKYFKEAQNLSKNYRPLLQLEAKWIRE